MNRVYWIVSVPYEDDSSKQFKRIKTSLEDMKACECFELKTPKLKIASVNDLLQLSDDFSKYDSTCESITMKVLRTLGDVGEISESDKDFVPEVIVQEENSVPVELYLNFFQWDENQYLTNKPLRELADGIFKKIVKLDEELKIKISEYTTLRLNVQQLERKNTGSLAVKSLDGIIKKDQIIESEYLTTLFVVVPKSNYKEWEVEYSDFTEYVAPDSTELICEEGDSGLFSVILLKKIADDFKSECIKRRFVVREFHYDEQKFELSKLEKDKLIDKLDEMKRDLIDWCKMAFSECFSSWIHLKVIVSKFFLNEFIFKFFKKDSNYKTMSFTKLSK
ncbi:hypothetical protein ABK040_011864 [Willaertia magna]